MKDDSEPFAIAERAIFQLWTAINELARVEPPAKPYFRVSIFGSARVAEGEPLYEDVKRLARQLAEMGCDIVSGGGPGLMQAANEGEQLGDPENKTRSIGVRVALPFEQHANPFVEKLYTHQTFFSRLHHFMRLSSAFVIVGGGIGTTLEAMLVWQLLQVRHANGVPLIMVGEMWKELVAWARKHMLSGPTKLAGPKDIDIPICVDTVDEAAAEIASHLARWKASLEKE